MPKYFTYTKFLLRQKEFYNKPTTIIFNYIKKITIKNDAKKIKDYEVSKSYSKLRPIIWP